MECKVLNNAHLLLQHNQRSIRILFHLHSPLSLNARQMVKFLLSLQNAEDGFSYINHDELRISEYNYETLIGRGM